jgi:hypothetical protein
MNVTGGGGTTMALFGMEHYEVIITSWLAAAIALTVVTAVTFSLVFGRDLLKRRAAAPRVAGAPDRAVVEEPARPQPAVRTAGTPIGAV